MESAVLDAAAGLTLASTYFLVLAGMAFVLWAVLGAGAECWALTRRAAIGLAGRAQVARRDDPLAASDASTGARSGVRLAS